MEVECTDGQTLAVNETMEDLLPDTLQTGSHSTQTPPQHRSLADGLGDIKQNVWF
ncbi:hypothetical protein BY454_1823 [Marinobacter persicus]|uniref:Uncharacterized protein n=1 Tax=Marinobacter persicus TaxID=930118 RepID=A0A2S6G1M0_9GAMM|nr:hypothetical protein BY455_1813 [Marinobacter persicus]PPK50090.1 hypothetical protein B0H24_10843 [Marinobacter persicus]PPK54276.1 hypothetical protein BY454_1823 [Marinobacter persicus]